MASPESRLLQRLDGIAAALRTSSHAVALLGLGSVGQETDRLDEWSDLDFFVIVEPGHIPEFLDSLWWLAAARPLVWSFRNTADGHKALMDDGVFCEFAVFEPARLAQVPYTGARLVWVRDGFDLPIPTRAVAPPALSTDVVWIVGEALSNLLVGLQRWHRGERLAGSRLVEGAAVDRLLELVEVQARGPSSVPVDPFVPARRVEQRHPEFADELASCVQGIEHTRASAAAVLTAFEARVPVDQHMARRIREMVRRAGAG